MLYIDGIFMVKYSLINLTQSEEQEWTIITQMPTQGIILM